MKFAIAGEGLTDFVVLKNLLIGFFNDKNLQVTRLRPVADEPFGWPNLFNFLSTPEFANGVINLDYTIVQVDTKECVDWNVELKNIGDDRVLVSSFINEVIVILVEKIGQEFYDANKNKILFAVTVHDMECWLLPFNIETLAHQSKMVNCIATLERIANKKGFSINQKNYQSGKHYDEFSKDMKNNKELIKKSKLNPSLQIFIEMLERAFPPSPTLSETF
jgi:hypothetical protein